MGRFLENLYDVLFHPVSAMRQIAGQKLVWQALGALLLSILIPAAASYFTFRTGSLARMLPVILLVQTLGSLFIWFVGTALFGLIAELSGGRGTAAGLLAARGFAQVPWILGVPISVLAMLFPAGVSTVVLGITTILILAWVFVLDVAAIRGAFDLRTSKAVLVLLTPLLAMIALMLIVVVFLGTAFIPGRFW